MEYEERLVCFADLMGFKAAIDQSLEEPDVRQRLYEVIKSLGEGELESFVYGAIPIMEQGKLIPAREKLGDKAYETFHPKVGLEITQFSDSFVFSAPAQNFAACEMLIKSVCAMHLLFFMSLGMMIRGGIAVGKLIHTKNGPLFGPAMNMAYTLESKSAIYPRVVISKDAHKLLDTHLSGLSVGNIIKPGFDGHHSFDLIDIFNWPMNSIRDKATINNQLLNIEQDILKNSPAAHPKISYLLNKWSLVESEYS